MNCPVCGSAMEPKKFEIEVPVCKQCKGIWIEHVQLIKLEHEDPVLRAPLEAALQAERRDDVRRPLTCPKCKQTMHAHKYERSQNVTVDECYLCGGFFLDPGELQEILHNRMSDAELNAFVDKMVDTVPGYAGEKLRVDAGEQQLAARRKLFRRLVGSLTFGRWTTPS